MTDALQLADKLEAMQRWPASDVICLEVANELRQLYEVNAELVEALQAVIRGVPDTWEGVVRAKAVLRKSQGDNNG